jgi:hypothetical protein
LGSKVEVNEGSAEEDEASSIGAGETDRETLLMAAVILAAPLDD